MIQFHVSFSKDFCGKVPNEEGYINYILMNDCLVFGNIVSQRENINEFLANNSVPLFLGSPSIGSVYTFEEFISTT